MSTPPRHRENQLFPTPRPEAYPPPSPLPWTPAPAPVPAWRTHAADTSDPHKTRLLVPALRMGSGAPSVAEGDKPTDLYYDISGGALYVCATVAGNPAWLLAGSDSYTKAEIDTKNEALSQSIASANSMANTAYSAAQTAQEAANNAYNTAAPALTYVNDHIANRKNPHGVSASQIGVYTKAEIDTKLRGYLTGETDPVFTDWRDNSRFLTAGYNLGSVNVYPSPDDGSGTVRLDGSIVLGSNIMVYGYENLIDHVTLLGSDLVVPGASESQANAVVLGHNVRSHGADTFNIGAPSLDKVYLGAFSDFADSASTDNAKTLQSLLDEQYALSSSLSGYLPLTGGVLEASDWWSDAVTNDSHHGRIELSPSSGPAAPATIAVEGAQSAGGRISVHGSYSEGDPGELTVYGVISNSEPDDFGSVVVRGSGPGSLLADVKIAGNSVRGLFPTVAALVGAAHYSAVYVHAYEADLSSRNRSVVCMRLGGPVPADVSLTIPSDFPSFDGKTVSTFDCVVQIDPGGSATSDGSLSLQVAGDLGGDIYLADGSEAKVFKDGVTVVTITGAKETTDSAPEYLVSVRHFTKLEAS